METVRDKKGSTPEKLNFLLQVEYLIEQMTSAHIPIEEGYERLITLVFDHSQEDK